MRSVFAQSFQHDKRAESVRLCDDDVLDSQQSQLDIPEASLTARRACRSRACLRGIIALNPIAVKSESYEIGVTSTRAQLLFTCIPSYVTLARVGVVVLVMQRVTGFSVRCTSQEYRWVSLVRLRCQETLGHPPQKKSHRSHAMFRTQLAPQGTVTESIDFFFTIPFKLDFH